RACRVSGPRRGRRGAREFDGLGAGDRPGHVRLIADVKLHRALERKRTVHGGARADRDARDVVTAEVDAEYAVVVGLLHLDPAVDHGIAGDVDVAVDRGDTLADVRGVDGDVAVDIGELAFDGRAGGQTERAVHGGGLVGLGVGLDVYGAVYGTGVGNTRACRHVDRAVDAADASGERKRQGQQGEDAKTCGSHGNLLRGARD